MSRRKSPQKKYEVVKPKKQVVKPVVVKPWIAEPKKVVEKPVAVGPTVIVDEAKQI